MQPDAIATLPIWAAGLLMAAVAVGGAVLIEMVARRLVPQALRERHTSVASAMFTVIGTTYAVLLAFVAMLAWEGFNKAQAITDAEASQIKSAYQLISGLKGPEMTPMRDDIVAYARAVVLTEWPAQAAGRTVAEDEPSLERLTGMALSLRPGSIADGDLHTLLLSDLGRLGETRRDRLFAARTPIPAILWFVLVAGGGITVGFASFLGAPSLRMHLAMSSLLAISGALVLLVIVALSNPFRGDFRVTAEPFERVLALMGPSRPLGRLGADVVQQLGQRGARERLLQRALRGAERLPEHGVHPAADGATRVRIGMQRQQGPVGPGVDRAPDVLERYVRGRARQFGAARSAPHPHQPAAGQLTGDAADDDGVGVDAGCQALAGRRLVTVRCDHQQDVGGNSEPRGDHPPSMRRVRRGSRSSLFVRRLPSCGMEPSLPERQLAIRRASAALCQQLAWVALHEMPLPNGRRADLLALRPDGGFVCIEVKSGVRDYLTDGKWPEYRAFCDALYFAVDDAFPCELLPDSTGLIVACGRDAELVRPAPTHPLPAARRRALTQRFATVAASRLAALEDPAITASLRAALRVE